MPSITVRAVAALEPGSAVWDNAVRGFGVRRQRGDPVYVLKYRIGGRQRFLTIGRHGSPWTPDTARREARRLLGLVAAGTDPSERAATAQTLRDAVGDYLSYAAAKLKPRSLAEVRRHLQGPSWSPLAGRPLGEIDRAAVAARLRRIKDDRGPVASTHARFALSALFKWAIGAGLASANPVTGTNREAVRSRERVLADAELAAIWRACGDDDYGRIVRLLILTGQRRDEVGGMRWAELGPQGWTIPAARTKNSREHLVPLPAAALALLPPERREFVFGDGPRRRGDPHRGFSGWSKGKAALDARSGVADWRLHDLRRTGATLMADRLGVLPHIIEAALNHVSGHRAGVAGVYNRAAYTAEVRRALEAWAGLVARIVDPQENVVAFRPIEK
jgi:integrase